MTSQTHHFYDRGDNGDDTHSVVVTNLLGTGRFKAYLADGPGADVDVRGYGHTRLAAIADLLKNIDEAVE